MSKFEIGDRVKDVSGILDGGVHVVSWSAGTWIKIDDTVNQQWSAHRFELYAKVGEFVVGDVVAATRVVHASAGGFEFGERGIVSRILPASPSGGPYLEFEGRSGNAAAKDFRLVASDEIAVAEPTTTPLARELMQKLRDNDAKTAAEIPASEFDFSTIKAGDTLVLHVTAKDGMDDEGDIPISLEHQIFSGRIYIKKPAVHAIIRAKTLRERAIEAVRDSSPSSHSLNIEAIVDLVLAEVERGES